MILYSVSIFSPTDFLGFSVEPNTRFGDGQIIDRRTTSPTIKKQIQGLVGEQRIGLSNALAVESRFPNLSIATMLLYLCELRWWQIGRGSQSHAINPMSDREFACRVTCNEILASLFVTRSQCVCGKESCYSNVKRQLSRVILRRGPSLERPAIVIYNEICHQNLRGDLTVVMFSEISPS